MYKSLLCFRVKMVKYNDEESHAVGSPRFGHTRFSYRIRTIDTIDLLLPSILPSVSKGTGEMPFRRNPLEAKIKNN